jgi:hypothetical protein
VLFLQDSLQVIPNAYVDSSVKGAKFLDKFQFERIGFFSVDSDTTPSKVGVFFSKREYKNQISRTSHIECQKNTTTYF